MFKNELDFTIQDIKDFSVEDCEEKLMYIRYLMLQDIEPQMKEGYEVFRGYLENRLQNSNTLPIEFLHP